MNVTVKGGDLARELALLEKIAGRKVTIPVLANVLIQANAGGLLLTATDLEIGLVGACLADVQIPGAVTLPARKLMELVRAQSHDNITLSLDANRAVTFTSGKFRSRLQSLPAVDFPKIPTPKDLPSIVLPRGPLRDLISKVRYAVSEKDKRYMLNGALMVLKENELLFVATDAARVSLATAARVGAAQESALLPTKSLDELIALLQEPGNDDVTLSWSDRHYFFDFDGRLFISRQIDGKFPAYERIIPKTHEHIVQMPRIELATVLKRMILISEIVLFIVQPGTMALKSTSADIGEGDERVEITYDGPQIEIRLKGQYVLDFLEAASGQTISLALKDAAAPALFTDGDAYLNVIMGMRV